VDEDERALIAAFAQRPGRALFVPELLASLADAGTTDDQVERALAGLERAGVVIVRPHFCGDPHLDGADLRVAAVVGKAEPDEDAQANAIADIEAAWQRWIGDYLASHRCT